MAIMTEITEEEATSIKKAEEFTKNLQKEREEYKQNYPLHYIAGSLTGIEEVEKLLEDGQIDINAQDHEGYTALDKVGTNIQDNTLESRADIPTFTLRMFNILLKNGAKLTKHTPAIDIEFIHNNTYYLRHHSVNNKPLIQMYVNIISDQDGKIPKENHKYIDALFSYDDKHSTNSRVFLYLLDKSLTNLQDPNEGVKSKIMDYIKKSYHHKDAANRDEQDIELCRNIVKGFMIQTGTELKTHPFFIELLAKKFHETSKAQLQNAHDAIKEAQDAAREDLIGRICDIFLEFISNIFNVSLDAASKAIEIRKSYADQDGLAKTFVDKITAKPASTAQISKS